MLSLTSCEFTVIEPELIESSRENTLPPRFSLIFDPSVKRLTTILLQPIQRPTHHNPPIFTEWPKIFQYFQRSTKLCEVRSFSASTMKVDSDCSFVQIHRLNSFDGGQAAIQYLNYSNIFIHFSKKFQRDSRPHQPFSTIIVHLLTSLMITAWSVLLVLRRCYYFLNFCFF